MLGKQALHQGLMRIPTLKEARLVGTKGEGLLCHGPPPPPRLCNSYPVSATLFFWRLLRIELFKWTF